jgi:hypothetical protein
MLTRSDPPARAGPIQLRADVRLLPGVDPFYVASFSSVGSALTRSASVDRTHPNEEQLP